MRLFKKSLLGLSLAFIALPALGEFQFPPSSPEHWDGMQAHSLCKTCDNETMEKCVKALSSQYSGDWGGSGESSMGQAPMGVCGSGGGSMGQTPMGVGGSGESSMGRTPMGVGGSGGGSMARVPMGVGGSGGGSSVRETDSNKKSLDPLTYLLPVQGVLDRTVDNGFMGIQGITEEGLPGPMEEFLKDLQDTDFAFPAVCVFAKGPGEIYKANDSSVDPSVYQDMYSFHCDGKLIAKTKVPMDSVHLTGRDVSAMGSILSSFNFRIAAQEVDLENGYFFVTYEKMDLQ